MDNLDRQEQLQAQMNICLDNLRREYAGQMLDVYDELDKLPRLKGEKTPTLAGESRVSRDDTGAMVAMNIIPVPGLSQLGQAVLEGAAELYGSRKATLARPQDKKPLSEQQLAAVKDKKKQLLERLETLAANIDFIDVNKVSGDMDTILQHPEINAQFAKKKEELDADNDNQTWAYTHKPKYNAPRFAA